MTQEATRRRAANGFDEEGLTRQLDEVVEPKSQEEGTKDAKRFETARNRIEEGGKEYDKVLEGRAESYVIDMLAIVGQGHVIKRGNPGSGKTLGSKTTAVITGLEWKKIQFTPDLMPQDITGSHVPVMGTRDWVFKKGPVFTNLLIGEEINRASPKTLAGLIQATGEGEVTSWDETYPLPDPFTAIFTMNPVESEGVFHIPEAQLDRALMLYDVPPMKGSGQMTEVVERNIHEPIVPHQVFKGPEEVRWLIGLRQEVRVQKSMLELIERIVYSFDLRKEELEYDPAERAAIALARVAQGVALFDGRSFVTAGDIRKYAVSVLQHRLRLNAAAKVQGQTPANVVRQILSSVPDSQPKKEES